MAESGQNKSQMLYDELAAYCESDFYPYHMPGHKRNHNICNLKMLSEAFRIDITEIDGFDNLHHAEGLLKQAQERAAELYGAEETFFLVNGSTCGILAAITAVTDKQDTVLIARNCHKSVYHAAILQELHLRYLYPDQIAEFEIADAVSPEAVSEALEQYPACRAVVITSPTYEGVISDIGAIAEAVHKKNKVLIVDEAHGAHLGLADGMPENAVRQGADIVIHSLHKTLPSMTQTALLHVNGSRVNRVKLRRYLSIYQSSSPSYVLMAGMDACISFIRENAADRFGRFREYYYNFVKKMEICRHIRIGMPEKIRNKGYHFTAWDIGKLVISVKDTSMSGQKLYDVLRDEFHLQMEMAAGSYVLAIMTIADEETGWQRLADALLQIDDRIEDRIKDRTDRTTDKNQSIQERKNYPKPIAVKTISQALHDTDNKCYDMTTDGLSEYKRKEIPLTQAAGKVAADFVNLYPPGIPLLVPGEVIEEDMIGLIQENLRSRLPVQGVSSEGTVYIL